MIERDYKGDDGALMLAIVRTRCGLGYRVMVDENEDEFGFQRGLALAQLMMPL